ncbi:MAG: hypothetical protein H6713_35345 [Myxococcales bacterium]|nr:hypothetical protein [Myxococcales bacterium]MCB9755245.1 hypothetical protein [Myxococcales bacterium]
MRENHLSLPMLALGLGGLLMLGCSGDDGSSATESTDSNAAASNGITITSTSGSTGMNTLDPSTTQAMKFDMGDSGNTGPIGPGCGGDSVCNQVDVLFVIDNSGTMGEEQINLAQNFPGLIQKLQDLEDTNGEKINPDVNIMVTTTDFGHPLCDPFEKPDYEPAKGAPITTPCTERLERFTGLTQPPTVIPEACTSFCTNPTAPSDPYIHFNISGTNVPGDDLGMALSCIGPQGIDGCGMEAPLESMLQALNPSKPWNDGTDGNFLRPGALLALVLVTDEADCSVKAPDGYDYFDPTKKDDPAVNQFWATNPENNNKEPTSAVCWLAGVNCTDANLDGEYESCVGEDNGVLHDKTRYIDYIKNVLIKQQNKDVVMLGILGVPLVTAYNPDPPYEPIAGGVKSLVYRDWIDGAYPAGDILPGDADNAAKKQFLFGIGPGCTGEDGQGGFTGQAIPPVRVKEVCESLNVEDNPDTPGYDETQIRCCIESICSTDFSPAIDCLAGLLTSTLPPVG